MLLHGYFKFSNNIPFNVNYIEFDQTIFPFSNAIIPLNIKHIGKTNFYPPNVNFLASSGPLLKGYESVLPPSNNHIDDEIILPSEESVKDDLSTGEIATEEEELITLTIDENITSIDSDNTITNLESDFSESEEERTFNSFSSMSLNPIPKITYQTKSLAIVENWFDENFIEPFIILHYENVPYFLDLGSSITLLTLFQLSVNITTQVTVNFSLIYFLYIEVKGSSNFNQLSFTPPPFSHRISIFNVSNIKFYSNSLINVDSFYLKKNSCFNFNNFVSNKNLNLFNQISKFPVKAKFFYFDETTLASEKAFIDINKIDHIGFSSEKFVSCITFSKESWEITLLSDESHLEIRYDETKLDLVVEAPIDHIILILENNVLVPNSQIRGLNLSIVGNNYQEVIVNFSGNGWEEVLLFQGSSFTIVASEFCNVTIIHEDILQFNITKEISVPNVEDPTYNSFSFGSTNYISINGSEDDGNEDDISVILVGISSIIPLC